MQTKPRVLLVEDDADINQLIKLNLETLDYSVTPSADGTEAYGLACESKFDLIILDIMLPGLDGLTVCKQLREQGVFTPILMLTAKNTEADRVVGLEVGADDYLTKPFSILELRARAKAMLRRMQFNAGLSSDAEKLVPKLDFGSLIIDPITRSVSQAGQSVTLTAKEFDLLLYLAKSPGRVYSRGELLDAVWGYSHGGYEHTVNSHINRLRSKLEQDPAKPEFVLTVWGVGYKFQG